MKYSYININNSIPTGSTLYKPGIVNKTEDNLLRSRQNIPFVIKEIRMDTVDQKQIFYPYKQLFEIPSVKKKIYSYNNLN